MTKFGTMKFQETLNILLQKHIILHLQKQTYLFDMLFQKNAHDIGYC